MPRVSGQGMGEHCVDIVMCIEATGSMPPIINEVKSNAMSFYQKFIDSMEESDKDVEEFRIKVIVFRDYICDSEPMVESEFFVLPDPNREFRSFVDGIEACGGDGPENALEAMAMALRSNWTTKGSRRRHAILVFSDAPALPLGKRAGCPNYPKGLPKKLAEFGSLWEGVSQMESHGCTYQPRAGRLVAFVPNTEPWTDIQAWKSCCQSFHMKTQSI